MRHHVGADALLFAPDDGIVVLEVWKEDAGRGPDATAGLVDLLDLIARRGML